MDCGDGSARDNPRPGCGCTDTARAASRDGRHLGRDTFACQGTRRSAASVGTVSVEGSGGKWSYAIVDPTPIRAQINKARIVRLSECGRELDLARLVHADRVLIGEVDKVSTLIGSLHIGIVDVATGQHVFSRALSFRGDTDEAWQHAARFFVRELQATAGQQQR